MEKDGNISSLPELPLDIIRLVCQHILLAANPAQPHLLIDPYICINPPKKDTASFGTPAFEPSPKVQAQQSLKSLCLVSKQWNFEARKALWASGIQFGLPRTFETVVKMVDPIGSFFDGGVEPKWFISPPASRQSSPRRPAGIDDGPLLVTSGYVTAFPIIQHDVHRRDSSLRSLSPTCEHGNQVLQSHSEVENALVDLKVVEPVTASPLPGDAELISGQTGWKVQGSWLRFERSISPLIAVQTLSQSFRRTSMCSPSRRRLQSLSSAEMDEVDEDEYVFDQQIDDLFNPAPHITSLSFEKYRSHGMRRSVAEGCQNRFVTPERLLRLLKSTRSRYAGLGENEHHCTRPQDLNEGSVLRQGKLEAVGFSEYMDSAITKDVLDEILLRGGVEAEYETLDPQFLVNTRGVLIAEDDSRGRTRSRKDLHPVSHFASPHPTLPAPVREPSQGYFALPTILTPLPVAFKHGVLPIQIERRLESSLLMESPVKALDLCGCVSSNFRKELNDFVVDHALSTQFASSSQNNYGASLLNSPNGLLRSTQFPHLNRLGLSRIIILTDLELANFLSGFVNLRDLDLSYTRAGPMVLHTLQRIKKCDWSDGDRRKLPGFRSLNLAKCKGLTKESLVGFLCGDDGGQEGDLVQWEDPMGSIGQLEELCLFGDSNLPTPIDSEALERILNSCPALLSGSLTTLDLSSVMIDHEFDLSGKMPAQPHLLQFGIASCPNVSLEMIRDLLLNKMRSVEVLDISASCFSARPRPTTYTGYNQSLPPLSAGQLHQKLIDVVCCWDENETRITNLRVIELEEASLQAIRGGAGGWKAAFGKGQRGWYVDLSVAVKVHSRRPLNAKGEPSTPSPLGFHRVLEPLQTSSEHVTTQQRNFSQVNLQQSLTALKGSDETIRHTEIGWMSRKTEILHGSGLLGRQEGLYGFHAFANT